MGPIAWRRSPPVTAKVPLTGSRHSAVRQVAGMAVMGSPVSSMEHCAEPSAPTWALRPASWPQDMVTEDSRLVKVASDSVPSSGSGTVGWNVGSRW